MTIDHLINDNGGGESTLNEDFDTWLKCFFKKELNLFLKYLQSKLWTTKVNDA
jgi:hypothetical protein